MLVITRHRDDLMLFFFFQAEDGIRDLTVTGVQTCALPIYIEILVVIVERGEMFANRANPWAGRASRSREHLTQMLGLLVSGRFPTLPARSHTHQHGPSHMLARVRTTLGVPSRRAP